MGDGALKAALLDQLARVGKALGSGKRLELLDLLAQAERPVEAVAMAAGLGVTTASAHLQTLKHAGLVATRREGTRIYYRIAGPDVADLLLLVRRVAAERLPDVAAAREAYLDGSPSEQLVESVDCAELLRWLAAGKVVVIDVRPEREYAAGHLPGAISIPVDEFAHRLVEIPTNTTVVVYSRGPYCAFAHDAVRLLRPHGRVAYRLCEGVVEWRSAGYPVASSSSG